MREIYNSYKLLGYKINELSNGWFLALRPDGKSGLVNSEGELIKGNLDSIKQLSNELYSGYEADRVSLFNNQGEVLEEVLVQDNKHRYVTRLEENYVVIYTTPNNTFGNNSVYSLDGKAKFKDIHGTIYNVINDKGIPKIVYKHTATSYFDSLKVMDNKGNIEIIDEYMDDHYRFNNHYIEKINNNRHSQIRDFQGNKVYSGDNVTIDTKVLDNDTIIERDNNCLEITYGNAQIKSAYVSNQFIQNVQFTYDKNVIIIEDSTGMYLLNIKTMQKSSYYKYIKQFISGVVVHIIDSKYIVEIVDTETFQVRSRIQCEECKLNIGCKTIVIKGRSGIRYYTLDFRQLVHEI